MKLNSLNSVHLLEITILPLYTRTLPNVMPNLFFKYIQHLTKGLHVANIRPAVRYLFHIAKAFLLE